MYKDSGKKYWRYVLIAVIFGSLGTVLRQIPQISFGLVIEVVDPSVTSSQFPFADAVLSSNPETRIVQISIAFLISVFLIAGFRFISSYFWDIFKELFQHDIRVRTYESIQNLHPKRFIQRSSGEYLSVVESDVREVGSLPRRLISGVINDAVNIFTIGAVLFSLNWQLSILLLLPIPFIAWYTFKFNRVIEPLYKESREASSSLTNQLSSSIRGILTVRSYVAEDRETDLVEDVSENRKNVKLNVSRTWLLYSQVFSLTSRFNSFLVLALGSFWVVSGPPLFFTEPLTAGELAVFFTNSTLLIQPATSVRKYVDKYKDAMASSDRIYSIMRAEEIDKKPFTKEYSNINGNIKFDDVVFRYNFDGEDPLDISEDESEGDEGDEEDFVFGPVDCTIEAGETIGVVGPSGSGKTTFIRLLMRFIDPDRGSIYIDGEDTIDYNPRSIRNHIGYVEQEPYIFDSSLRENIQYGDFDTEDEKVREALEKAVLSDTVSDLSDGLDTELGESGGKMSGGEKQRVAIARAILTNPSLLVLDEATSHVDNITESKIQQSIDEASENRTTIIIAHRLSTVRKADKILVFDDGQIVEQGAHDDLVEQNGLYNRLWSKHIGKR